MAQRWHRSGKKCWTRPFQKSYSPIRLRFSADARKACEFIDKAIKNLERCAPKVLGVGRSIQESVRSWSNQSCVLHYGHVVLTQQGRLRPNLRHDQRPVEQQHQGYAVLDDGAVVKPPICGDCIHHHGVNYYGTILTCAMHPYGPEGSDCVDKKCHD